MMTVEVKPANSTTSQEFNYRCIPTPLQVSLVPVEGNVS